MDISDSKSKITTCLSGSSPCTASFGGTTCDSAAPDKGGVVCSSCPAIVEGNWNIWSSSCTMGSQYKVEAGKTVKIKKSSSMPGELVIDRGSDTIGTNFHFYVEGTLEMEDVTLTGGHAVSSFIIVRCFVVKDSFFDGDFNMCD